MPQAANSCTIQNLWYLPGYSTLASSSSESTYISKCAWRCITKILHSQVLLTIPNFSSTTSSLTCSANSPNSHHSLLSVSDRKRDGIIMRIRKQHVLQQPTQNRIYNSICQIRDLPLWRLDIPAPDRKCAIGIGKRIALEWIIDALERTISM